MQCCWPILLNALCYCVAYWPDFKENVPPREVWASVSEPKGSLEKAILLALREWAGHRLSEDFVNAGIFEDQAANSLINSEVSSIRVTEHVRDHLDGVRHTKEEEEDTTGGD